MRHGLLTTGATVIAVAASLVLSAGAASAGTPHPVVFIGIAGGTELSVGGVVTSGPTSESFVQGTTLPASDSATIASGSITGLVDTGVISTDETATAEDHGAKVVSHAQTGDLDLLGGQVDIGAVDTTSTVKIVNNVNYSTANTTFADLHIANINIPVNVPQNYTVTIPGVAQLTLNYKYDTNENGELFSSAGAITLTLLADYGDYPAGSVVFVNPIFAGLLAHYPGTPYILGGSAYGTQLIADAADLVGLQSGPTAEEDLPSGGTNGQTLTNNIVGVTIPGVLTTGALTDTAFGTSTSTSANGKTTSSVTGVNLFGGLVRAKAISAYARAFKDPGKSVKVKADATFTKLVIDGQKFRAQAAPNTVITVAGLGYVMLNVQTANAYSTDTEAIRIILTTAEAGLPAGAVIDIANASAYIIS